MDNKEKKRQRMDCGPWLLTEETLENIDTVMEKAYNNFSGLRKITDEECYNLREKSLRIWFNNNTNAEFQSFKEFSISDAYSNLKPIKFKYEIDSLFNKINIELTDDWPNGCFQYYVRCEDSNLEDNLIYDIYKIYTTARPSKLIMATSKIGILSWVIYLLLMLLIGYIQNSQYQTPIKNMMKAKIYQILSKEKLSQEDYFEITKYTIIDNFKFYDLMENDELRNVRNKFNQISVYYVLIGFLLCIIISLNPKASFAAGRSIAKVRFWKTYYRVIYYIIPAIIILPILINIISNIIMKNIY